MRGHRLRVIASGDAEWEEVPLPPEAGWGGNHALPAMMASFVAACRRGALAEGDASFADGLAAQRLLDAAQRSAGSGWVEVAPPALLLVVRTLEGLVAAAGAL